MVLLILLLSLRQFPYKIERTTNKKGQLPGNIGSLYIYIYIYIYI